MRLLLSVWLALPSFGHSQSDGAQLIPALSEARTNGCASRPGASALRAAAALDEAARGMARGQDAMQAAQRAGYRATRVFQANFSGYGSAAEVAQAMRQRYCTALTDPGLREAGAHREGKTWWVVLAAPFEVPQP